MRFDKIPIDTFKQIQLNAGVLLNKFEPQLPNIQENDRIGATSGGIIFSAKPTFKDFGEDIDNCPKNTKELKKLESWEVLMSGTFTTLKPETAKMLVAVADVLSEKITPRNDLADKDFSDLWFVGDYSDENGAKNGGMIAIHIMNALSTGGFQLQTADREKGKFAFEFMGHYSMAEQDKVPFEIYVKAGTPEEAA